MARFRTERDDERARGGTRGVSPKTASETPAPASSHAIPRTSDTRPDAAPSTRDRARSEASRGPEPRTPAPSTRAAYELRGRTYRLTSTEADVVRAAGVFRTVRASDLLKGVYQGDKRALERELNRLGAQKLITTSTFRGRPRERFVNLTPEAKRLADAHLKPRANQRIYSGMAKVRELDHDAALYGMYLRACEGIRAEGRHPVRVILDYELKKSLNRDLEAIQNLPPSERDARLQDLASAHALTVIDGKIPIPDVRIEYETREGEHAHVDLEYVTGNYRSDAIAAKARAGFSLYAPAGFDRSSGGSAGRRVRNEFPSLAAEIVSI